MALRKDGNSNSSASYKPYDASNSFVRRMANRVTGIIGWRSDSRSESQPHISSIESQSVSQNYSDLLHSSTDEESILPTAKRSRVQSEEETVSLLFKPNSELREICSPIQTVNDNNVAGPSNKNQCVISSTPMNTCSSIFRSSSSLVHSNENSQTSNTSFTDHFDSDVPKVNIHQRHSVTVPSLPRGVPSQSSCFNINKSLSGSISTTNSRRPSFNVDVFSKSNRRLSLSVCENRSRSCVSPFYSARTMYGGASALLPYSNQTTSLRSVSASKLDLFSPRSQITMQPVPSPAKSNDQETMSTTARRILDTLETYCSPIMDAKRIPLNESSKKSVDINQEQLSRGMKRKLPPLNQIIPSTTDLLRLKRTEKMQESISSAKQTVSSVPESSIIAEDSDSSSDSTELDYSILTKDIKNKNTEYVGKIKRKTEGKFDDRPLTPVKLPKAVLQISNLPKFDVTDIFTFSKPLLLENFDENTDDVTVSVTDDMSNNEIVSHGSKSTTKTLKKTVPTVSNSNSTSTITKKIEKSHDTVASSFTEVFKNEISATSQSKLFSPNNSVINKVDSKNEPMKSHASISWTCKLCLSSNVGERCSKCSGSRDSNNVKPTNVELLTKSVKSMEPQEKVSLVVSTTAATASTSSWGDTFKPPADTWECKECFVRNKTNDNKCVSCQSPKSDMTNINTNSINTNTTAQISLTNISGGNDLWKNMQKSSADTWKCDSCWIQNKQTEIKCVACGATKESKSKPAEKESPKMEFSFGVPKSENDSNIEKPAMNFGFGSTLVSTSTIPPIKQTFPFGLNTASSSTGDSSVKTLPTASSSQFQFNFKTTSSIETPTNNTTGFKNIFLNASNSSATNKTDETDSLTAQNKKENVTFNDVSSSTNNTKNPLLKGTENIINDSIFKTPKFIGVTSKNMTSNKENGTEEDKQNVFSDISSSTESLSKRKLPSFSTSTSIFNKESTNGLPNAVPNLSVTNGTTVSSSSNLFTASLSAPTLVSGGSKITNDIQPSFGSISNNEITKMDDKNNTKLFAINNVGVSSSSSPATNSIFGNFSSVDGFHTKKPESSSSFASATANFSDPVPSTFNFGSNSTQSQPGGFSFNGPKAEDNNIATPKFTFGVAPAATTNASNFGNVIPTQFNFNAQGSNFSTAEQRPLTNSIFGTTAKTPQHLEMQSQLTNSTSPFGNSIFGASQQQPSHTLVNPIKKSGGFSFVAPNQFANQSMNSFTSFTNSAPLGVSTVDENQEQNRLINNAAPTSSTFIFGNPNQTNQSHNFNFTVPSSFNFTSGNSSIVAQPASANPTQTNAQPRRIKKAVRRTTK